MSEFVFWTCGCGSRQAMSREAYAIYKQNHATFYCVHGHPRHYPEGPSEEEKLRRERDRLQQNAAYLEDCLRAARDNAQHERNRANGYKGFATKITKRAKAGICPCCNRHFAQLERHMSSKHPDFTPIEIEDVPMTPETAG